MACILVNCVTLAMYDPLRPDDAPDTAKHVALGWLELALTLVFVAEAVMKIAAFHFWRADGNGCVSLHLHYSSYLLTTSPPLSSLPGTSKTRGPDSTSPSSYVKERADAGATARCCWGGATAMPATTALPRACYHYSYTTTAALLLLLY